MEQRFFYINAYLACPPNGMVFMHNIDFLLSLLYFKDNRNRKNHILEQKRKRIGGEPNAEFTF